jgi:predicted dehydrogenase
MKTLALIGVGRWGRNIVSTLETLPNANLKYLCNQRAESLESYAAGYKKILDWHDLLEKDDLDAVLVATPPASHAEIASAFLRRRIPVFIEKPMTASLDDARRIEQAAYEGKTDAFIGHIHLYNPAYRALRDSVYDIGDIRAIEFSAGKHGPIRDDVSALWDWASHDVALAIDLVHGEPISVQAWGICVLRPKTTLYDIVSLKLKFPNNTTATIRVSWLEPENHRKVTVWSSDNMVVFDDMLSEKKVLIGRSGLHVLYPIYDNARPLTEELKAFLAFLDDGDVRGGGIAQGLSVVRILDAAERSIAEDGKEVIFKL